MFISHTKPVVLFIGLPIVVVVLVVVAALAVFLLW